MTGRSSTAQTENPEYASRHAYSQVEADHRLRPASGVSFGRFSHVVTFAGTVVHLGDTGGTTRRILRAEELGGPKSKGWKLAQHLGTKEGKRLLVLGSDQKSETAELAHEQLVTQWPQYQLWLQGTEKNPRAADKRSLDQLMEHTRRWRERSRRWRDLATGSALLEFRSLARRRKDWLAPTEATFVTRSRWRWGLERAVVAVLIAAFLAAGVWAFLDQRQKRIAAEVTSISFQLELADGKVESRDVAALLALAGAGCEVRLAFIDELLERPSLAVRFARNPAVVTRGLVGLDPSARQRVAAHAFGPQSATPETWEIRNARALLGLELGVREAVDSFPYPYAIRNTTDPDALLVLGQGLAALAPKLTAKQANAALEPLLEAIRNTTDTRALLVLGQGLAALAPRLTAKQANAALEPLLEAIRNATERDALEALGEGLAALATTLTAEQASVALEPLLETIRNTTEPFALVALGEGIAALQVDLTAEQASVALEPLLEAIRNTTEPFVLQALSEGIAALQVDLTAEQASVALEPLLE